jgi:asparagine synthase (glutamine-hydrolysing)
MKVDKTTMAASLEARCPFLDQRLIEFVGRLPTAMKIGPGGTKLLLKRALRGLVPDELLDRKKHGFEVPIRKWMLGDLAEVVHARLLARDGAVGRYLDLDAVERLWRRLASTNDGQLARQVWTLLNLAVWLDVHVGPNASRPRASGACVVPQGAGTGSSAA